MKPLRMAVVGLGYWGPNLARNISSCNATDLFIELNFAVLKFKHTIKKKKR